MGAENHAARKKSKQQALLKYDAIVDQRTDEKWENVKLTFSSSHDNNIPVSPILTSLPITTHEDQDSDPFSDGDPVDTGYEQEKSNARDRDLKLNQIAAQRQHREVTTEKSLQLTLPTPLIPFPSKRTRLKIPSRSIR